MCVSVHACVRVCTSVRMRLARSTAYPTTSDFVLCRGLCTGWHRDPRAEVNKTDDRNERVPCPKNGYRFFNLDTNPNELEPAHSPDAALENAEMFTIMKKRLRRFQKEEVVIPTYVTLGPLGPGRPWNNDGSFQIGDCEYNTQIAADRA